MRPTHGHVEADEEDERHDECGDPPASAQIAADVGTEGGEADRDRDQTHHLAEDPARVPLDLQAWDAIDAGSAAERRMHITLR